MGGISSLQSGIRKRTSSGETTAPEADACVESMSRGKPSLEIRLVIVPGPNCFCLTGGNAPHFSMGSVCFRLTSLAREQAHRIRQHMALLRSQVCSARCCHVSLLAPCRHSPPFLAATTGQVMRDTASGRSSWPFRFYWRYAMGITNSTTIPLNEDPPRVWTASPDRKWLGDFG